MNDVYKKEEIRNIVMGDLRGLGIKYRQKKLKPVQVISYEMLFAEIFVLNEFNFRAQKQSEECLKQIYAYFPPKL